VLSLRRVLGFRDLEAVGELPILIVLLGHPGVFQIRPRSGAQIVRQHIAQSEKFIPLFTYSVGNNVIVFHRLRCDYFA
jgi:hypothetical protein